MKNSIYHVVKESLEKISKKNELLISDILLVVESFFKNRNITDKNEIDKFINDIKKSKNILTSIENILVKISGNENYIESIKNSSDNSIKQLKNDINKLFLKVSELTEELHSDELTDVYNRKWLFHEYLKHELYMPEDGVIIFIDIDDFKNINDKYGHHVGDKVLKYFTDFIKKEFINREYNNKTFKLIRFAGDEFIIIVNDFEEVVKNIIEEISKLIKEIPLSTPENREFNISFSYGLNSFNKNDNIHDIMKKADSDMYLSKSLRKSKRL